MAGKVESSSLQSTKRLLDELDELMEKMLALPVSDADELPSVEEAQAHLPKVSATLTVLEESTEPDGPAFEFGPSATAERPRLDPPSHVQTPHHEFLATAPTLVSYHETVSEELPVDAVPPSLLQVRVPEVRLLPIAGRTLGTILLQPLLAFNLLFDVATRFLGPFGRWLRTGQGRNALGVAGIGLFVLAIGWLVRDWLSWTR